jgi:hypothetical protein
MEGDVDLDVHVDVNVNIEMNMEIHTNIDLWSCYIHVCSVSDLYIFVYSGSGYNLKSQFGSGSPVLDPDLLKTDCTF